MHKLELDPTARPNIRPAQMDDGAAPGQHHNPRHPAPAGCRASAAGGTCRPSPSVPKVGKVLPTFRIKDCEKLIRRNLGNDRLVGRLFGILKQHFGALKKNGGPKSWAGYCRRQWDRPRRNIDYLIAQSRVADLLKLPEDFPVGRLKPLIGLPDEVLPKVWQTVLEYRTNAGGYPTQATIKRAAQQHKPGKDPMAEWNLDQAKADFVRGVHRLAAKVASGATDDQRAQFASELPALLDHLKEFCEPINL